jgi:hypothetical protein
MNFGSVPVRLNAGLADGPWRAEREFGLAAELNTALELPQEWTAARAGRAPISRLSPM